MRTLNEIMAEVKDGFSPVKGILYNWRESVKRRQVVVIQDVPTPPDICAVLLDIYEGLTPHSQEKFVARARSNYKLFSRSAFHHAPEKFLAVIIKEARESSDNG